MGDPDQHLFRLDWVSQLNCSSGVFVLLILFMLQNPELKSMSLQLLGNGDPSREEPEVYVQRWQSYIESFTSVCGMPFNIIFQH